MFAILHVVSVEDSSFARSMEMQTDVYFLGWRRGQKIARDDARGDTWHVANISTLSTEDMLESRSGVGS